MTQCRFGRSVSFAPRRGDVYYIEPAAASGSEQAGGRPAVIVSNDMNNQYSGTVEIVYMTTRPKKELPTHVSISSLSRPSIALCEQIHTVDKGRFGSFICKVTEGELSEINSAMMVSLGLENPAEGGRPVSAEMPGSHSCRG